jgi:DNA-binding transcriptional MerR regulator
MKKLYYSISEVSEILQEEQHILRYWEKEFEIIRPRKNRGGNRIYSPDDLEIMQIIKQLIRDNYYSIKQAKDLLDTYPTKSKIIKDKAIILSNHFRSKNGNKANEKQHHKNGLLLRPSEKEEINRIFEDILTHLDKFA